VHFAEAMVRVPGGETKVINQGHPGRRYQEAHDATSAGKAPASGLRRFAATTFALATAAGLTLFSPSPAAAETVGAAPFAGTVQFHGSPAQAFFGCDDTTPYTVSALAPTIAVDTGAGAYVGPANITINFDPWYCMYNPTPTVNASSGFSFTMTISGGSPSAGTLDCTSDWWNQGGRYRFEFGGTFGLTCTINGQATPRVTGGFSGLLGFTGELSTGTATGALYFITPQY
jgi:hypothetical protein